MTRSGSTRAIHGRQSLGFLCFSVLDRPDVLVQNIDEKHLWKVPCRVESVLGQGTQSSHLCSTRDELVGLKQE